MLKSILLAALVVLSPGIAAAQHKGAALVFDGANDRLIVPLGPTFPSEVYTVTAWIRTSSLFPQAIMSRGEDSLSDALPWGFSVLDRRLYLQIEYEAHLDSLYAS